jgi:hypothetical protein
VLFLASDGNIPVALSKSEGAGSVVALASLPGAHLNIRSSGMRLPDGCYGPATHINQHTDLNLDMDEEHDVFEKRSHVKRFKSLALIIRSQSESKD